jgi:ferrous iron transport protein B
MLSMYLLGVIVAAGVALILKRTLLRGPAPPFVLELPTYKWPSTPTVVGRMVERGWSFIYRAGTLILAVTILVWAAGYFPHDQTKVEGPYDPQRAALTARLQAAPESAVEVRKSLEDELATIDNEIKAAYQRQSILGRLGHAIEPVVRPLGWDWRIGSAVLASFPAREVVVGVLGVIYDLGANLDVGTQDDQHRLVSQLRAAKWDETATPVYNLPVALSIMVFFALCAQCASTLVIIRRETNSWRWPVFTFAYMTGLAYVGALVTYQVGRLLSGI